MAFSLDGATLASGSEDATVRLFDTATHRPLGRRLRGTGFEVPSLQFTPDGRALAAVDVGGIGGTVRLWDSVLWSEDLTAFERRICPAIAHSFTSAEWRDLVPGEPYHETCP